MARTMIYNPSAPQPSVTGNTQTTVTTEGVVESVEDVVSLISPYDTPFYSALRKVQANEVIHYWQEDVLATPSRTNAQIQGVEPTGGTWYNTSSPGMKANYVQLFMKTARVSGTARSAKFYGRGDELDYQKMKRGREIRVDIEAAMLGDNSPVAPAAGAAATGFPFGPSGAGAAAGVMASASYLIHTAATDGNTTTGAGAVHTPTSGVAGAINAPLVFGTVTSAALTEAGVLACQRQVFNNGGNPNMLLCSPYQASIIANFAYIDPTGNFASASSRTREVTGGEIVNYVDVYRSPFGTLSVVIDRFVMGALAADADNTSIVFLLETDKWHIAQLREMQSIELAKTGDNDKAMLISECTLVHENTRSSGQLRAVDDTP